MIIARLFVVAMSIGVSMPACAQACSPPVLTLEIDRPSFSAAGYGIDAKRADTLKQTVASALARAFTRLCEAGQVRPDLFAGQDELLIQNGDGATEPLLYIEDTEAPLFIFQFAFQNGPAPGGGAVERAVQCYATPDSGDCFPG